MKLMNSDQRDPTRKRRPTGTSARNFEDERQKEMMLTAEQRKAGFIRLWSEVKYNFVFFDKVPELELGQGSGRSICRRSGRSKTGAHYYRRLSGGNVPGSVEGWAYDVSPPFSRMRPPAISVLVRLVDGKAIVVDMAGTRRLPTAGIARGLKLRTSTVVPWREILRQGCLSLRRAASTPQDREAKAYRQLLVDQSTVSQSDYASPDGKVGRR